MPTDEIPGIVQRQLEGAARWYDMAVRDYRECVIEKAIADRACTTWEQTVERLVALSFEAGRLAAHCDEAGVPLPSVLAKLNGD